MQHPSSDIAFTPAVKDIQRQRQSRAFYEKMEAQGGFRTGVTPELVSFLAVVDTAFLATATKDGQPYAQHRGGPKGFIRALDAETIGFVDYSGNRQYVTTGNLSENDRAFLFLIDYAEQRRVKLWGRARIVEGDEELTRRLMPENYRAWPEQVILFTVEAWDVNCKQHIPRKLDLADVAGAIGHLEQRLAAANAEIERLRGLLGDRG